MADSTEAAELSMAVDKADQCRAIEMVTKADQYLQKRELLHALNLYKSSVEILPDPEVIHKIRKLRKYMKKKGLDLEENKENVKTTSGSAGDNRTTEMSKNTSGGHLNNSGSLKERVNIDGDRHLADRVKESKNGSGYGDNKEALEERSDGVVVEKNRSVVLSPALDANPMNDDTSPTKDANPTRDDDDNSSRGIKDENSLSQSLSQKVGSLSLQDEKPPQITVTDTGSTLAKAHKPSPPKKYEGPVRNFSDLRKRLYPHQKEGMKWLARLFQEGKGGILGDDMGLGKTLQIIGYLSKMFEVGEIETVLLVLPSALILPWQSEITKWAPLLNFETFHGKGKSARKKALHSIQRMGGLLLVTYGLIVTSYEELSTDQSGREFIWDYVILDEGHKIKNPNKTQKAAHYIPSHNRIIVTGTPIQNNLVELWFLFDFVHHGSLMGTLKTFKMNYDTPITRSRQKDASMAEKQLGYIMAQNLQKIIAPYFLRRTKAEIMSDPNSGILTLPRKNDLIVWVKMTEDQRKVYESYLSLQEVKELMSSSRSPLVALNILKKLCDHLRLLSMRVCKSLGLLTKEEIAKNKSDMMSHMNDPAEVPEWLRKTDSEEQLGSSSSKPPNENDCAATQLDEIPDEILYKESSKLMVVIQLLGYLISTDHKCLVFSQSVKMLDIIQQILNNLNYSYVRMDGKIINLEKRAQIIRQFEMDKSMHIFLLTTQVGGVGLNLTMADRIIVVDPSWNPAIDSQAVDRIYRIGQTKNVIIFRLITCGSVEEKIYIRQLFKLSVNRQATKESKDPFRYFTKQDLKQLFIVENLLWSDTQQQLAEMYAGKRQSDEVVNNQIEFLESINHVFGISDHDLVFSREDGDQEARMSNPRIETMMAQAEQAIRSEVNEGSIATVKKIVPGVRERLSPATQMLTSHGDNPPTRESTSPLLQLYNNDEESASNSNPGKRQSWHRSRNHSLSPVPKSGNTDAVVVLTDTEAVGSDTEVIMDSGDEQPVARKSAHNSDTVADPITFDESMESDYVPHSVPAHTNPTQELNQNTEETSSALTSSNAADYGYSEEVAASPIKSPVSKRPCHSAFNMTLMKAIADSPQSSAMGRVGRILVADSPDVLNCSTSSKGSNHNSSSRHSRHGLSTANSTSTKCSVADSDDESDNSSRRKQSSTNSTSWPTTDGGQTFVVANSENEDNDDGMSDDISELPDSEGGKQGSTELHTPAFRDLSMVVPNSSPRVKDNQEANSEIKSPIANVSSSSLTQPAETDSFARDRNLSSRVSVNNSPQEMEKFLGLDESVIVGSVKRTKRQVILSSSDDSSDGDDSNDERERSVENDSPKLPNSSLADSVNSTPSRRTNIRKRKVLSSESEESDSDGENAEIDNDANLANDSDEANISIVTEQLNISTNPSEPILYAVKTPPSRLVKSSLSRILSPRNDEKSSSSSQEDDEEVLPFRKTNIRKRKVLSSESEESDSDGETAEIDNDANLAVKSSLSQILPCNRRGDEEVSLHYSSGSSVDSNVPGKKSGSVGSQGSKNKFGVSMETDDAGEEESDEEEEEESEWEEEESSEEEEESNEEEGSNDSDEDEESDDGEEKESEDITEFPSPSKEKSKKYNKLVLASREAYEQQNYKEAMLSALQALEHDASDLTLQTYALRLRKLVK